MVKYLVAAVFCVVVCSSLKVNAQTCYDLVAVDEQKEAHLMCDLDSLSCLQFSTYPTTGWQTVNFIEGECGASIENPHWISFIAWDSIIDITLTYANCHSPSTTSVDIGVQLMLTSGCISTVADEDGVYSIIDGMTPLYDNCDCDSGGDSSGSVSLTNLADGMEKLEIGQRYYLVIDGCAGNICDVKLEVNNLPDTDGSLPEPTLEITNANCDENVICPDSKVSIDVIGHEDYTGVDYSYTVYENDVMIDQVTTTIDSIDIIPNTTGKYRIELMYANVCDDQNPVVVDSFEVVVIDTIRYPRDTICFEERISYAGLPANWISTGCLTNPTSFIEGLNTLECEYTDDCGCVIVEIFEVFVAPEMIPPLFDTVVCIYDLPLDFRGIPVTDEFTTPLSIPRPDTEFGCDSSAMFAVYAPYVDASFEVSNCDSTVIQYRGIIDDQSPYLSSDSIGFEWFVNNTPISTGQFCTTNIDEEVSLDVIWIYEGVECRQTIVKDTSYTEHTIQDFEFPEVLCRTSNDTVFFDFSFLPSATSTVDITQMSTHTSNYWDSTTWVFPSMGMDDIVQIKLESGSTLCSGSQLVYQCSLGCVDYQIELPDDGKILCSGNLGGQLPLVANINPPLSTDAVLTWYDENDNVINSPYVYDLEAKNDYTFKYKIVENGCEYEDAYSVTIFEQPTLNIMQTDITVCEGTYFNTDTIVTIIGKGAFRDGLGGFDNDKVIIIDQQEQSFTFTFDNPGEYKISYQACNESCCSENFAVINITVEKQETFDIQCFDNTLPIQFLWDNLICVDSYDIYANGEYIRTQDNSTYTPSTFPPETYVTVDIVPNSSCQCPYEPIQIECYTGDCELRPTSMLWRDTTFCPSNTPTLLTNRIYFTDDVTQGQSKDIDMTLLGEGVHILYDTLYDKTICPNVDSFRIVIESIPELTLTPIAPDCYDSTMGTVEIEGDVSLFKDTCVIDGQVVLVKDIVTLTYELGSHQVVFQTLRDCEVVTSFSIPNPSDFNVSIMGDAKLIEGTSGTYSLDTDLANWSNIYWYLDGELICTDVTECEIFSNLGDLDTMVLNVELYANDVCARSTSVDIAVEKAPIQLTDIFIPNIISPNQIGQNSWIIAANTEMVVDQVSIFDRWGNKVYDKSDFVIQNEIALWDGTLDGRLLEQGVYVYILKYQNTYGESKQIVGDITLIR